MKRPSISRFGLLCLARLPVAWPQATSPADAAGGQSMVRNPPVFDTLKTR